MAVSWGKSEEIALVQFIALFSELKTGEWPTFGDQHEYWGKAAEFIQETVGASHKQTSKNFFLNLSHIPLSMSSYFANYDVINGIIFNNPQKTVMPRSNAKE